MNTSKVEHKYQDWDKGILRLTLKVGTIKRLQWFWNYMIRRKPLFVEIQFYGKRVKEIDPETYHVFYTSLVESFMADMENFSVAFLNSEQIDAVRSFTDGDE